MSDRAKELADELRADGVFVDAADEIDRLRAEVARRTAERDEARREVCYAYGSRAETLAAAERRGWDCFDAKEVR
jgi:undecaprenyl pyrophosphate synthase